jgi:hypothetical protein
MSHCALFSEAIFPSLLQVANPAFHSNLPAGRQGFGTPNYFIGAKKRFRWSHFSHHKITFSVTKSFPFQSGLLKPNRFLKPVRIGKIKK